MAQRNFIRYKKGIVNESYIDFLLKNQIKCIDLRVSYIDTQKKFVIMNKSTLVKMSTTHFYQGRTKRHLFRGNE